MVKTSLIYFVLALVAGVLVGLRQWPGLQPLSALLPAGLFPVYLHLYMVGWVTMLIFGVVFWMFPKYTMERPRGSERAGWAVYWLLNAGLALRAAGETLALQGSHWGWVLVLSALLQLAAAIIFVLNTWPRVKEK